MTAAKIFDKYTEALTDLGLGEDEPIHADAILLALRLAIGDAYTAGADSVLMQALDKVQPAPDQRLQESLQAQIERLNEWLETHQPALYFSPNYDTDGAILVALAERDRRIATLRTDLDNAIGERDAAEDANRRLHDWLAANTEQVAVLDDAELAIAIITGLRSQLAHMDAEETARRRAVVELQREVDRLTRENTIATDTLNSTLEQHRNGTGATAEAPQWWSALDDETNDYRISLEHGRRKFREVPKPARLLLAQAFARSIGSGALPKQSEFDAHKPDWMPGGGGLVTTFGCSWSELLALSPLEVTP